MNRTVGLFMALIASLLCTAQSGFNYQVRGNLKGLNNDSVVLCIRKYDKTGALKGDTVLAAASNNQFTFRGQTDAIHDAIVRVGGLHARKSFILFLENGIIEVNGHVDSLDNVSVTGTAGNDEYTDSKRKEDVIYQGIRSLQAQLKQDPGNKDETGRMTNEINALRDSIKARRILFISTRGHSPVSAIYLYVLQDQLPVEQLEALYTNLTPAVKNIGYVKAIPDKILARKRVAPGNTAPEFEAMDIDGRRFTLADFRGKYVLLEFWASWCVPCRAENPDLVKAYKTYREKGFVIIGISLDDKKERWEKAIMEDQLPWIHTSELNAFDNKLAKLYGVQPIPDNFLIDPQGKIIARQLSGKEVAEKLSKEIK